jgi:hypothetical protein
MPTTLRSRVALLSLMGVFLIPVTASSLRGLTHVLTCREEVDTPFSMVISDVGDPLITTSNRIERGQEAGVCGGLSLDMAASIDPDGRVAMTLPITNHSDHPWRGTVSLSIGDTTVPVDIGSIDAGQTEADTIRLRLDSGTHELRGSLLIGP